MHSEQYTQDIFIQKERQKNTILWSYDTHFKKYYKMIAIDLSEQQALDACPKVIH